MQRGVEQDPVGHTWNETFDHFDLFGVTRPKTGHCCPRAAWRMSHQQHSQQASVSFNCLTIPQESSLRVGVWWWIWYWRDECFVVATAWGEWFVMFYIWGQFLKIAIVRVIPIGVTDLYGSWWVCSRVMQHWEDRVRAKATSFAQLCCYINVKDSINKDIYIYSHTHIYIYTYTHIYIHWHTHI